MARPEGFEPPAPRFVVWCSIQLSYGRAGGVDIGGRPAGRNPRRAAGNRGPRRHRPVLRAGAGGHREKAMKPFRVPALTIAAALLAGCVSQGPFPSLAPRPDERLADRGAGPRAAADRRRQRAARADQPPCRRGPARATPPSNADYEAAARARRARRRREGSDSWIDAQQAFSRAEASRSRATDAAAGASPARPGPRRPADQPSRPAPRSEAAIAQADGIVAAQQARLEPDQDASRRSTASACSFASAT